MNTEWIHAGLRLAVNLTLISAVLWAVVTFAFRLLPTTVPRLRYIIAVAAFLAATIAPFAVTLWAVRSTTTDAVVATFPAASSPSLTASEPVPTGLSFDLDAVVDAVASSLLGRWFVWMWVVVAALLLGRELFGHWRLWRARRTWQPASSELGISLAWPSHVPLFTHEQAGPSAVGLFRPVVVLSEAAIQSLLPAALQRVAQHELAHVRWRDPLVNALLRWFCAWLWPSVPLWLLARLIAQEREAAADQAAIKGASEEHAADYATTLIAVARLVRTPAPRLRFDWAETPAGEEAGLEARVRRLLIATRPAPLKMVFASLGLLVSVVGAVFLPLAAQPGQVLKTTTIAPEPVAALLEAQDSETPKPVRRVTAKKKSGGTLLRKATTKSAAASAPESNPNEQASPANNVNIAAAVRRWTRRLTGADNRNSDDRDDVVIKHRIVIKN